MRKFISLTIFGIAMGFLEAAVVVYLRDIIYPEGFCFPLKDIPVNLLFVELGREVATIIMLITIGIIAGKTLIEKFSYFLFSFGIWDIFYYIWLKVSLNWPPSLFTDDILFLIPIHWVGPIIAPVIVSLTMITFSLITVYFLDKGYIFKPNKFDWLLICITCIIIFISFILDFPQMIAHKISSPYRWELLITGELLVLFAFIRICRRKKV